MKSARAARRCVEASQRRRRAVVRFLFPLVLERAGEVGGGLRVRRDEGPHFRQSGVALAEDHFEHDAPGVRAVAEEPLQDGALEAKRAGGAGRDDGGGVAARPQEAGPADGGPGDVATTDIEILVPLLQPDLVADGAVDQEVERRRGRELLRHDAARLEGLFLGQGCEAVPVGFAGGVEPAGFGAKERGTLVAQIGRRQLRHG